MERGRRKCKYWKSFLGYSLVSQSLWGRCVATCEYTLAKWIDLPHNGIMKPDVGQLSATTTITTEQQMQRAFAVIIFITLRCTLKTNQFVNSVNKYTRSTICCYIQHISGHIIESEIGTRLRKQQLQQAQLRSLRHSTRLSL